MLGFVIPENNIIGLGLQSTDQCKLNNVKYKHNMMKGLNHITLIARGVFAISLVN